MNNNFNNGVLDTLNLQQKKLFEKINNQNNRLLKLNLQLSHANYKIRERLSKFVEKNEKYLIDSEEIYEIFEIMQSLK